MRQLFYSLLKDLLLAFILAFLAFLKFGPDEWVQYVVGVDDDYLAVWEVSIIIIALVIIVWILFSKIKKWKNRREILLRAEKHAEHISGRLRYVRRVVAGEKSVITWCKKLNTQRINIKSLIDEIDKTHLSPKAIAALEELKISDSELDKTIDDLVAETNKFTPEHISKLYKHRAERLAKALNKFIQELSGRFHSPQLVENEEKMEPKNTSDSQI